MINKITLSIITVNLNNKIGLEKTINSVINQIFNGYEFIIIDGGSSDGSKELIIKNSDKLAYWISEPDRGIYHAMNKGILLAKGQYCLFLNSGDWLINKEILKQIFSKNYETDIITGGCNIIENRKEDFVVWPNKDLTLKSFINNTLPHQATLIGRHLFEKFGLYDENFMLHADFDFWIRVIIIGQCSVKNIRIIVSNYNMNGLSSTTENVSIMQSEISLILSKYFPKTILKDYYIWLKEENNSLVVMRWAKSQILLYSIIEVLYKISKNLKKIF